MGWLRLVGSLKLQVSFAEYRLFYRAFVQKRHVILRSLLTKATPWWERGCERIWNRWASVWESKQQRAGMHRTYIYVNSWVSFTKKPCKRDNILQKRPHNFQTVKRWYASYVYMWMYRFLLQKSPIKETRDNILQKRPVIFKQRRAGMHRMYIYVHW